MDAETRSISLVSRRKIVKIEGYNLQPIADLTVHFIPHRISRKF